MFDDCSVEATICQGDLCCGTATKDANFLDCTTCTKAGGAGDNPVVNKAKDGITRKVCADRRQKYIIEVLDTSLATSIDGKPAKYDATRYDTPGNG